MARWTLPLIVLAALVLRVVTGLGQSFWYDEVFTYRVVEPGLGGLVDRAGDFETTPPLYYALIALWRDAFGVSELALRVPSAIFGAGTVWLTACAARRLVDVRAGWWAAALVAVSPLLVWLGQDARAYSLGTCAAAGLVWATVTWLRASEEAVEGEALTPAAPSWVPWAVFASIALATHYSTWPFVGVAGVVLLAFDRVHEARRLVPALAVPALVAAAHVPFLRGQLAGARAEWIGTIGFGERLRFIPKQLAIGFEAPLDELLAVVVLVIFVGAIVLALRTSARRTSAALLVLAVGTLLISFVSAKGGGPDLFITRSFAPLVPVLAVVVAGGLTAARMSASAARRLVPALGLIALLAMSFASISASLDSEMRRPDWRGAVEAIPDEGKNRFVSPSMQAEVVRHYRSDAECGPCAGTDTVDVLVGNIISGGERAHAPARLDSNLGVLRRTAVRRRGGVDVARYQLAAPTAQLTDLVITTPGYARIP